LQSSLIGAVAVLLSALMARYPAPAQSPVPSATTKPSSTAWDSTSEIFRGLASKNPEVTVNALESAGILLDKEQDPVVRRHLLLRIAWFVRSHAPMPTGGTYDYCTKEAAPPLSSEVLAGMQLIGLRRSEDLGVALDLSGANLAYAKLPHLRLDNITFDGALLCRTIMVGSTFSSSTFEHATLRYSITTGAVGLTARELTTVHSLCGAELPLYLRADPALRKLEVTDPEPYVDCNVHD
jgi:hypothetical protein